MVTLSLGGLLLLLWLFLALDGWRGQRSVPVLRELPERPVARGDGPTPPPRVCLIAAARNEAPGIEAAIQSWLALEYPALEVVLINDRSTDQTGPACLVRVWMTRRWAVSQTRMVPSSPPVRTREPSSLTATASTPPV